MIKFKELTQYQLILIVSLFLVLFGNISFFRHVIGVYPVSAGNIGFLLSLAVGLTAFIVFLFALVASRYSTKPVLIAILLLSSAAAYFMDHYGIVIDQGMIVNVSQTDTAEVGDLLGIELLLYILFLGILPAVLVYRANIVYGSFRMALVGKFKTVVTALLVVVLMILPFGRFYTSFFREHKPLRFYTNPVYYIYSGGRFVADNFNSRPDGIKPVGEDAAIPAWDKDRELIVLVIGEAARADHFSLNGYDRPTNPLLEQKNVINFPDFYSSGTSTAESVPCMFSLHNQDECDSGTEAFTQNLLDVLNHAGVHILWRDNNSGSKGVALRVRYENFRKPANNPICDEECRDIGMLEGLPEYIKAQASGDILIVLHQMGNHGPAYYKRYPAEFERFTPVCRTNELNECSREEIVNSYDNAILYTDYFLSSVIDLLDQYNDEFETAMVYMSDHGESLGEAGIYLHGLPYIIAPDAQKHIPVIMWFGKNFQLDRIGLRARSSERYNHDNLFHSILGLMEMETNVYNDKLDILKQQGSGSDS